MIDEYAKISNHPENPQQGKIKVEVLDSLESLRVYSNAWDNLAYNSLQKIPTLSYAWVSSYFEYLLQPDESWVCLMALEDRELVGVLPVVITRSSFLGIKRTHIRTPHNKHSFSVDFLAADGREHEAIPLLLAKILDLLPNIFEFSLNRLPENSQTLSLFSKSTDKAVIIREFDGLGSYLSIDGSMEAFRKTLSRNFSRNLTKANNKLARLADVQAVFYRGDEATERSFERFANVEASGWKGQIGTAIEMSPMLVAFYKSLTKRLSESGWLEWHFLEAEGQTIAGQLAIRMGRTLIVLKIGYDEKYSFCAPGNILFEKTIERAYLERDTDEINCITDMPWHDNWRMSKRNHFNLWIYPKRPIPLLFGALPKKGKIGIRTLPVLNLIYRKVRDVVKGEK